MTTVVHHQSKRRAIYYGDYNFLVLVSQKSFLLAQKLEVVYLNPLTYKYS